MYTVKQLSDLAQISVRTLHYYDEIGLLKPSQVGGNGYRYYDDDALLRLQQIMFYREIGMELMQIKDVLDSPDFDLVKALQSHRAVLIEKSERLLNLVSTVDDTIKHLKGEKEMSKRQLFQAFSDEKQKEYEREARLQYGPDNVNQSIKRWNSYTQAQKEAIGNEGNQVYSDIVDAIEAGKEPTSAEVQTILKRWHDHLRYFYEPTLDILRGLGELYTSHPDFIANFSKIHPELAEYMKSGINQYVDDLEYAEIERMLAEDDAQKRTS
ncbi:MAG: MerR family transcriptional regulator [Anaerolineaceae bacterium]|nr:MerR family transcriptional regulator [Anaerolineaceae bacterium]